MNGKPGDHPVFDIIHNGLSVYGEPTDSNVRKLASLMDYHRLSDWLDQVRGYTTQDIPTEVKKKLAELTRHARESGREVE